MWVILGIISAFFLGIYDVFKKASSNRNAVLPALFLACLGMALIFITFYILSLTCPDCSGAIWYVDRIGGNTHLLILLKSANVFSSWTFAYFSFKPVPVTIASPCILWLYMQKKLTIDQFFLIESN